MTAAAIRSELLNSASAAGSDVCKKLAEQFEDEVLMEDFIPDDYFQLFLDILSTERLHRISGVSDLFLSLYIEREKLTGKQKSRLIDVIVASYPFLSDESLCLVICDMVARVWPPAVALAALEEMANSRQASAATAVATGLEVIIRHVERGSDLHSRATEKYRQIMSTTR